MAIFRNFICCVFLCASVCFAGKGAVIRVHTQNTTPASVDRMLYGRFFEHHGGAVYPGIDEQYIINTSFEKYYKKGEDSPTPRNDINPWLVFRDVKPTEGVAYPWEPFGDTAKVQFSLDSQAFNSQTSQKIVTTSTGGDAGIRQRIALPDYRVDRYPVTLYARTTNGAGEIEVSLKACQGDTVSNRLTFCLSQQWQKFSGILDLKGNRSTTHLNNRQGIYELTISLKGEGAILLDQVTLYPADAVEGRWNPETIAHLKETGVTVIRWPGGNFASSYHWIDGVGPIDKRPTRPNLTWEGLENNHVGTDDFLHFCKLANLTPLICIGFDTCSVQEAADWVEYCNGGVDTTYGKLRAENGHPEPYAVKLWQIGNEVYGDYQIGHTNAKDYATRYLDYYEAIKKADPTIKVMAMGKDPGYQEDDDNAWNKTLFEIIGNKMDYLDIHRYVRGIRRRDELKKWDLTLLSEIYIAFSTQYDKVIDSIAQLREVYDVPDVKLAVTEWAEYLSLGDAQLPHAFSPANAVFYAGMMNSFIRNSQFVKISCSHDFSVFVSTKSGWNTPVLPRSVIAKMYSEVKANELLDIDVRCDTFDIPREIPQMVSIRDIPYLDVVATATKSRDQIVLFIVNRCLTSGYNAAIEFAELDKDRQAEIALFHALGDPMAAQTWANPHTCDVTFEKNYTRDGKINIQTPKCSVVRVVLTQPEK